MTQHRQDQDQGFYDDVIPLQGRIERLANCGFNVRSFKKRII